MGKVQVRTGTEYLRVCTRNQLAKQEKTTALRSHWGMDMGRDKDIEIVSRYVWLNSIFLSGISFLILCLCK